MRFRLDLDQVGDSIVGRVTTTDGVVHDFAGRLGLLAALDAVLLPGPDPFDDVAIEPDAGGSAL